MGPARTVASVAERLPRIGGSAQLGDERSRVERVEADPGAFVDHGGGQGNQFTVLEHGFLADGIAGLEQPIDTQFPEVGDRGLDEARLD